MERRRTQNGHPTVEEAEYRGYRVRVVAGWLGAEDQYVGHLYIVPPDGPEIRVWEPGRLEAHLDDVLDLAFAEAQAEIDFLCGDAKPNPTGVAISRHLRGGRPGLR